MRRSRFLNTWACRLKNSFFKKEKEKSDEFNLIGLFGFYAVYQSTDVYQILLVL